MGYAKNSQWRCQQCLVQCGSVVLHACADKKETSNRLLHSLYDVLIHELEKFMECWYFLELVDQRWKSRLVRQYWFEL